MDQKYPSKDRLSILPHIITLCSVLLSFGALVHTLQAFRDESLLVVHAYRAALLCLTIFILDGLDGRIARMINAQSDFGVQMDSLSDLISFCVVPALLSYVVFLQYIPYAGFLAAFIYIACGLLRLARFNVLSMLPKKEKPSPYFVGLPTSAAGYSFLTIHLIKGEFLYRSEHVHVDWLDPLLSRLLDHIYQPTYILILCLFLAYAMISEHPYFAPKYLDFSKISLFSVLTLLVLVLLSSILLGVFFTLSIFLLLYLVSPFASLLVSFFRRKMYSE